MITYEKARAIAIADTISDGKVYCSGDTGDFYIFIIAPKDFDMETPNPLIGSTYTAVDKSDGKVWTVSITDPRLKNVKKIEGSTNKAR